MLRNSFSRFFLHFFPLPRFFRAPSFGLDISDESIKYAELLDTRVGTKMGRFGERAIPPGIIESGKIRDSTRLQSILANLGKEVGIQSVRISLPEEQVYLFKLKLEKTGLKNVRESIELVLEEHVPIAAPDAIFDYEIIGEDSQYLELEVGTIPKVVVENYLLIFKNSGLQVQSCELEAQAIARAVVPKGDTGTYMIVDFGKKRTGIFIASHEMVVFTSTLDIGGISLDEAIAKTFNATLEEAEKMKQEHGLERNTTNREMFSVLLNSVSVLRDEIEKHYIYWHTHKDEEGHANPPIKKILLVGGDSNLIGLTDYLSLSMKMPVELANVWVNIDSAEHYVPEIPLQRSIAFAAALGLALGDYE